MICAEFWIVISKILQDILLPVQIRNYNFEIAYLSDQKINDKIKLASQKRGNPVHLPDFLFSHFFLLFLPELIIYMSMTTQINSCKPHISLKFISTVLFSSQDTDLPVLNIIYYISSHLAPVTCPICFHWYFAETILSCQIPFCPILCLK